jgi:2'-5' RNA ligase
VEREIENKMMNGKDECSNSSFPFPFIIQHSPSNSTVQTSLFCIRLFLVRLFYCSYCPSSVVSLSKPFSMSRPNLYYIAVVAPSTVEEKVLGYKHWMQQQFGCQVALKSPAHITLISPFRLAADREQELVNGFAAFRSRIVDCRVSMEGFAHFGDRVIFIDVKKTAGLVQLREETSIYFQQLFGHLIPNDTRDFHPHITIANRDLQPEDFEKAWPHFSSQSFFGEFHAPAISLLKLENGKWNIISENTIRAVDSQ